MTGKFTLRLREATSSLDEMSAGTRFQRVIGEGHGAAAEDDMVPASDMRRVVFCSGKVYYDLLRARKLNAINDVALVRVEQLSPFPFDLVKEQLDLYAGAEVVWCQEEPKNQGGWQYVRPRFETASKGLDGTDAPRVAKYTGRATAASTATGFKCASLTTLSFDRCCRTLPIEYGLTVSCLRPHYVVLADTHILLRCTISFEMHWLEKMWKSKGRTAASQ